MHGKKQIEFLEKTKCILKGESLDSRILDIKAVVKRYEDQYYDGLADRIESYIRECILSPSTPQWANLGRDKIEGKVTTPLPISCYITSPSNNIRGIYYTIGEIAMMSKLGGGVGVDVTNIYDKGTYISEGFYTNSKLDWVEDMVRTAQKVSQGSQRRGYAVPFIYITDPEFDDILKRAHKTNPDKTDPFVENNIGVILPKGFRSLLSSPECPEEYRSRYLKILSIRESDGKVYMIDEENCDKNKSPVYEKLGLCPSSSNICTEALTPKFDDKSFTCVLSSLNALYWDRIKSDPQIIKDCFAFLDINVSEFIRLTEGVPFMEKARRSAIEKRDIGLGVLGFHEYLQSKNYAFGDLDSRHVNIEIFKTIREYGEEYTKEIAEKLGSPKMCQEADMVRRNVSLMMVAPNKSTSFVCGLGDDSSGTSAGIELFKNNYHIKKLAGIQHTFKNPWLKSKLQKLNCDTIEVWDSIMDNLGSVAHLDCLSEHEKNVFRTSSEVSPKDIIDLAADRQPYIDMSQSVNLVNRPNYTQVDIFNIHKYAWERGLKTLYYYFSQAHAAFEQEGEAWDTCLSCAD